MTAPSPHRRTPRVELYERIVAAIHDGTFPPGSDLPSEPQLAARLGVSRPALREVLILLQEDGVITRRHGVGSRVNQHLPPRGLERVLPVESLLGGTPVTARRLSARLDEATDFSAHHLRLAGTGRTWFWETLLYADGSPACFAHEWAAEEHTLTGLVPEYAAALATAAEARPSASMLAVLLDTTAGQRLTGRTSIGATVLGTERGTAMDRPPESPAVLLTQVVSAGNRPVMAAKYLLPAGTPPVQVMQRR
ncbi:GntR family transcriptional regulator [Streptomyces sp. SID5910]|uniref:GntR family transcriptional regulator n=1 Tax=Streptomyces sp. SID5910 TaxID=2690312 RepID=UPI00136D6C02|nr:GntR family transcriptional regulator [Streptomyces sp. SID5910]MYR41888.1 GntR family transcriptional regulator [Streptomyces sp. SID5910]